MYVVRNIVGQGVVALTLESLTQELERGLVRLRWFNLCKTVNNLKSEVGEALSGRHECCLGLLQLVRCVGPKRI